MIFLRIIALLLLSTVARQSVAQEQYVVGFRGSLHQSWLGSQTSERQLNRSYGLYTAAWANQRLAFDVGLNISYYKLKKVEYYRNQYISFLQIPVKLRYYPIDNNGYNIMAGLGITRTLSAHYRQGRVAQTIDDKNRIVSPAYCISFGTGFLIKRPYSWTSLDLIYEWGTESLYSVDTKGPMHVLSLQLSYALFIKTKSQAD